MLAATGICGASSSQAPYLSRLRLQKSVCAGSQSLRCSSSPQKVCRTFRGPRNYVIATPALRAPSPISERANRDVREDSRGDYQSPEKNNRNGEYQSPDGDTRNYNGVNTVLCFATPALRAPSPISERATILVSLVFILIYFCCFNTEKDILR